MIDRPSDSRVVRTLKDGYWDRTEVIELPDGSCRVRKRSKGAAFGPWGVRSLRREIRYLTTLPAGAQSVLPPVLAAWDRGAHEAVADVGYEMPYYADHVDAGELARRGTLSQAEINRFQDALAGAVLTRLHQPTTADESLTAHISSVVKQAWLELNKDPALATLIEADHIELNSKRMFGPRAAFARIALETDALAALDAGPCVRLHGDLFLENILWRPCAVKPAHDVSPLLLVDPVSVAGVMYGPPVFDLVKYESYATGELVALRSEWVDVTGFDATAYPGEYHCQVRWGEPALQPFRMLDWHTRFRRAFEEKHGPVDRRWYRLLDGYFSAAMAVNTTGTQRHARLLKATAEFNAVLTLS